jgi:uroporphyrinogen-III decarboxylase
MDQIFTDMIDNPDAVHYLVNLCTDFWVAFLAELAPMRDELDAIYMFDDWGTQLDVMISPAMWREFFAAPYRRITEAAHANGMDFWLHSCGRVTNLIADFIDAGMDLISPFQSGACGYETVAERFAGRVAFLTTVDSQSTLTHGTPAEVLAECRRLERWGTPHGGLIIGSYRYDTPEENERTVFDYFRAIQLAGA